LHELFEKIFCIPATLAPVESVFSTSGLCMQLDSEFIDSDDVVLIKRVL